MLDSAKHKVVLIEILKEIYSDPSLRTILGFKGGTAALLFYDLPRLSIDLDFDLLDQDKKELVLKKIKSILSRHGKVREAREKYYTLFFLLSYEKGKHTLKIDISKRPGLGRFGRRSYLGIPMLVMKKEDMLAGKLALARAVKKTGKIKPNQLLQGMGELLDQKQKSWVKSKLVSETIFYLRLYQKLNG